ncbi:MAG: hypothetical protein H0W83_14200, partial [Planctomycetes bacterium]|nr:hypothetical protein [Planctomycetota bacterium]
MYQTFLRDALVVNPHLRVIGLTATPFRLKDGAICGPDNILNHVCYEVGVKELIRDGFLSPLISKAGKAKADTTGLHVRAGEFVAEEVERLCDTDDLVRAACSEIVEQTRERMACLIFAAGVTHAEHVAAVLQKTNGLEVACIFGHTPDAERDRIVARFKRGELRYLVNVAVLTTGFDAPQVDCVALLRPTMSAGLYYQMCLDMQTEVLTRRGWARCHEVSVGDEVAAFDLDTSRVEWCPAENKVHRPLAPGEGIFAIRAPHLDLRVTSTHTMIYRGRSRTCRHWQRAEAEQLASYRDSFLLPIAGVNDGPGISLNDDELRFLGWLLTDGHRNPHNNAVVIAQSAASPYLENIEDMLRGCGFGFRRYQQKRAGKLAKYPDAVTYVVPYGKPRGSNRHLRGWSDLAPYLDRPILDSLANISQRQVEILLEAMNLGDGHKSQKITWTRRTRAICIGEHRFLADQLQSLLIQRGYRCNINTSHSRSSWNQRNPKPSYVLHIRKQTTATVGGIVQRPSRIAPRRCALNPVAVERDEYVWCLATSLGTLVTRRNGKVCVVGNCGRGFRLAPGKQDCLVLDFGGNVLRHGPVDAISIAEKDGRDGGQPPAKECPQCQAVIAAGFATCPQCGFQFPPPERDQHEREASSAGVLSGQVTTSEYVVRDTFFAVHQKRGAPPDAPKSLRVEYEIGLNRYQKEWICFEHTGFARGKAELWWRARSREPV